MSYEIKVGDKVKVKIQGQHSAKGVVVDMRHNELMGKITFRVQLKNFQRPIIVTADEMTPDWLK